MVTAGKSHAFETRPTERATFGRRVLVSSQPVADRDPFQRIDSRIGALADLHVLIVEDNRDARDILAMVLQYFGAMVTAVRTAADGLSHLRSVMPDVVVADIQLPDHDAPWLTGEARRRGFTVPFIAISAGDFDATALAEQGFEAYLRKPVDHVRLVDTILAVVRRER
jgi:DNA-binding response OmpR family regulator